MSNRPKGKKDGSAARPTRKRRASSLVNNRGKRRRRKPTKPLSAKQRNETEIETLCRHLTEGLISLEEYKQKREEIMERLEHSNILQFSSASLRTTRDPNRNVSQSTQEVVPDSGARLLQDLRNSKPRYWDGEEEQVNLEPQKESESPNSAIILNWRVNQDEDEDKSVQALTMLKNLHPPPTAAQKQEEVKASPKEVLSDEVSEKEARDAPNDDLLEVRESHENGNALSCNDPYFAANTLAESWFDTDWNGKDESVKNEVNTEDNLNQLFSKTTQVQSNP